MNASRQIFIDLLQAALWNRPVKTGHWKKPVDWDNVYALAKAQELRGLVLDALFGLPAEWLPKKQWYEARLERLMKTAQMFAMHQAISNELLQRFATCGIHAQLMKGVTLATLYPHPQYRTCGDIDIYIGPEHYHQAVSLLCQWANTQTTDVVKDNKHTSLYYKGIEVEVHRITEFFSVPIYNRRWQEWTKTCLSNCIATEFPLRYNAVFLFNHIWHHFCIYGIGLRQFCDWTLFLHNHIAEINYELLKSDLKRIGLFTQWQIFGCITVNTLGLPKNEFPFYNTKYMPKAKHLLEQVFADGNFGKTGLWISGKPRHYLKRKLHSVRFWCKRLALVWQFSPLYATFTVLDYLKFGIQVVFNDLTKKR